jgi:hypothetical protein
METEEPSLFDQWIAGWSDLVGFEIVPVIASGDPLSSWRFAPVSSGGSWDLEQGVCPADDG